MQPFDLLVIGGGINGAGIACDAAGRGLRTALMEGDDFAGGTSSRSSKLIHGGLRYLAYFDFKLVRESLSERERLMAKAPHLIWPLSFVMPVLATLRPAWQVRLGLFLYDHLSRRVSLPRTRAIDLSLQPERLGFDSAYRKAFVYSDCWVDDARLVIANVLAAHRHGAVIMPRTECEGAERSGGLWRARVRHRISGESQILSSRAIVNAAGPWAVDLSRRLLDKVTTYSARLVRGSHIVVPKLYSAGHATMLQLPDGRVAVTMPYEGEYTLVGTTDMEHAGDLREPRISDAEVDYLLAVCNRFFARKTSRADIVWSYSGIRPLFEEGTSRDADPTQTTRDYAFRIDDVDGAMPLLTVLGGKLTTYRRLAGHALDQLRAYLAMPTESRTATEILPGGDIGAAGPGAYAGELVARYPWLSGGLAQRYARTYGSRSVDLLTQVRSLSGLGTCLGGDLYTREVDFLMETEWAWSAEDVAWRRTKSGLQMSASEIQTLDRYMRSRGGASGSRSRHATVNLSLGQ